MSTKIHARINLRSKSPQNKSPPLRKIITNRLFTNLSLLSFLKSLFMANALVA